MYLGKRSILDGLGLALAGAASEAGALIRKYLRSLDCGSNKGASILGSDLWLAPRFAAFPIVLEADRGFFRAAGGGCDASMIDGKLGNPWTFASPGVSIKPRPSSSLTHRGMGLMLNFIHEHDIKPEQVLKVR